MPDERSASFPAARIQLSRVLQFSAAHRYYRQEWSAEQNFKAFGVCANPHGHGHNYQLEVTLEGQPDPKTGMIVDLPFLDEILADEILAKVDHQHLNFAIPRFRDEIPTCENLTIYFWEVLARRIGVPPLLRLRLSEDASLSATAEANRSVGERQ